MDLIEIVTKSLTYFAILAIIVIVGSYVSYKVRKKLTGEKLPYEDDLEKAKAAAKASKSQAKKQKKPSEAKSDDEKDLKKPVIIHSSSVKHIHVKKKISDKTGTNQITEEDYRRKKAEYERRKKRKSTQMFTRKHRIQIVNKNYTSPPVSDLETKTPTYEKVRTRKSEETISPKKKKKLQSLDENVLDKYAAEDDDQFFTLKPGKKDD